MDINKLNKWADLLLDTGKRNNLINFKDTKMGTVEVVSPNFDDLFSKVGHSTNFEVYDPKLNDDDDEEFVDDTQQENDIKEYRISKEDYINVYEHRLKKNNQILIFNTLNNPIKALQNIAKKAKTAIEETGVNIAYMAFGFIKWTESETSQYAMSALSYLHLYQ